MEKRSEDNAKSKELPSTSSSPMVAGASNPNASNPNALNPNAPNPNAPRILHVYPEVVGYAQITVPVLKNPPSVTALKMLNASKKHESQSVATSSGTTSASRQVPMEETPRHQPVPQGFYAQGQQTPIHQQPGQFVHNEQIPVRILPGQYGPSQAQPLAVQYPQFQQMPPQYVPGQYQPVQHPQAGYVPVQQPQVYQGQVKQTGGYYMPASPTPYPQHGQYHPDLPQTVQFVPEHPHQAQFVQNPNTHFQPVHISDHRGQSIPAQNVQMVPGMQNMPTQPTFNESLPHPTPQHEFVKAGNTPSSVIPTKVSSANVNPADLIPAEMTPASVVPADLTPARTTLDDKTAAKDTDVMDTTTGDTSTIDTRPKAASKTPAKGIPVAATPADQQKAPECSTQHKIIESSPNTTDASFEDLALDALFIGDEPVDLPVFGEVSRADYEKDRQKYHQSLLQHQQVMLDSIKNRGEPTKPAEEEFQLVSKHKSFDHTILTEKQKEAVRSAEMQSRRERNAGLQAEKKLESVVEKATFDKEPCSSNSLPPSSSGVGGKAAKKAVQGKKPKPGKRNTEVKGEVAGGNKNNVFNKSIEYAMNVLLDAYFIKRVDLRQRNFSSYEPGHESDSPFLENRLLSNAVKHSGKLNADDLKAKNDYLDEVIAHYPQKEHPIERSEERLDMFFRFLKLLRSRDDEILIMDMAVIKSATMHMWGYYFTCNIQNLESVNPSDIVESSDKSGDTTKKTAQSSKPKEEDDEFEDVAKFNMIRKVEVYCEKRLKLRKSLYCYPDPQDDSSEDRLECALQGCVNRHPGVFTSTDVDLFQLVCGMVLKKLPTWDITEDKRAKVKEFYTMISGRQDDVLLMEAHVLNDLMKADDSLASAICCAYINLFADDRLQLPAKAKTHLKRK